MGKINVSPGFYSRTSVDTPPPARPSTEAIQCSFRKHMQTNSEEFYNKHGSDTCSPPYCPYTYFCECAQALFIHARRSALPSKSFSQTRGSSSRAHISSIGSFFFTESFKALNCCLHGCTCCARPDAINSKCQFKLQVVN